MKIIDNCKELMMDVFIDCLLNHNLKRLAVEGDPGEDELENAWEKIYSEYCDLANSMTYQVILKIMKNICLAESKLVCIDLCIIILERQYNKACIEILRKMGYDYKFDPTDIKSFMSDLKRVRSAAKSTVITLMRERKNYDERVKDNTKISIKDTDFDKIFVTLSKFMGFKVITKDTTVSEYCAMLKLLKDSNK